MLMLAGCMPSTRMPAIPPTWESHSATVALWDQWQLNGKIGVRSAKSSGSAYITWQQRGENFRIVMSGALGMGRLTLTGNSKGVTWTDSKGRTSQHSDPEALIEKLWGWRIPVGALRFWARGIPVPETSLKALQISHGTASAFVQSGWSLEFEGYRMNEGVLLPNHVRLEHEGTVLTLLTSRWSAPP